MQKPLITLLEGEINAWNWPDTVEGLYKDACWVILPGSIIGSTIKGEDCSIQEPNEKYRNWIFMSEKYSDENHLISPKVPTQSLWDFNTL